MKSFYKEKHFVVTFAGKVLFITKDYEDIQEYFKSPDTCPTCQNDLNPNIHIKCWEEYPSVEYKHVKILSDQTKYFLSQPANFLISQFGHIWQQYYYRLFKILFYIKDNSLKNSMIVLLGSNVEGCFTPEDSYYKGFTEKLISDFNIESYVFNNEPTIYEVDNFWANNGDYNYDVKRINEYLFEDTIVPWRKVYATKSLWYGKWKTPPYLYKNAKSVIRSLDIDRSTLYSDRGYDNLYEALVEQNVLSKRIYNENELEDFLGSYGFESIEPGFKFHKEQCLQYVKLQNDNMSHTKAKCVGGCSIEENIRYFNEVKTLVSISSSALQNMLFMNTNSSNIIELETRFFQVNGLDTNQSFMDVGKELNDADGEIDPEKFSEICNGILKKHGQYHPWHAALAHDLDIEYHKITNLDLNSRTIIDKMKRDPKIMEILSL